MSRILPDPLVGRFPAEVLAVHRALKAIPDDDTIVWVSLPLDGCKDRPDFLVVRPDNCVFLVAVAFAAQSEIEEAAGLSLFKADGVAGLPGHQEADRLRGFFMAALANSEASDQGGTVTGLVLFPNTGQSVLDQLPDGIRPREVFLLGREYCQPSVLADFLARETPPGLDAAAMAVLRAAFTPESVVPAHFSPSRVVDRNLEARLAPILLDYDQEHWAKHKLFLSPEAQSVAEDPAVYGEASLVTGIAGSGKSLVLLFRACTQARLAPATRALVLTHNRPLKGELEARFGDLGRPPNVAWHTFYSWVHQLVTSAVPFPDIVQYGERDSRILESAKPYWGDLSEAQIEFLREEFDWMQDRGLVAEADYLGADRRGRGVRLGDAARSKVFAAYRAYRTGLERENREDWSGAALLAWKLIQAGKIQPPEFDFIYIDEAQFFAPIWFRIVRAAQRPSTGQIHLAADPTQGFLKRRQGWSHCGLDLRGRSTRLRRSYRSTREILGFAADFYRARIDDDELSDLNLPARDELVSAPAGAVPAVIRVSARQDEFDRVANEIRACLQEGLRPDDILVIIAGDHRSSQGLQTLSASIGPELVADARETVVRGRVRICGINAATGLESPVVFLIGTADLIAAEADYHLKEEARAERVRDNTRRIYMACTRAARRLVITWTGETLPHWLKPPAQS